MSNGLLSIWHAQRAEFQCFDECLKQLNYNMIVLFFLQILVWYEAKSSSWRAQSAKIG
jgi:hypothetical protein